MEIFFGAFTSEWEQRRAALLHELSLGPKRRSSAEDEMKRRLKAMAELGGSGSGAGGGGGSRPKMRRAAGGPKFAAETRAAAVSRPIEARLAAVAQGSQPAVVKMASYGGGARVGAMLNYVSRGGKLAVENENGERIRSREDLARLRGDWNHLFQNRAESRDIGSFTVEIATAAISSDEATHELVRNSLTSAFGDRRYAYAVTRQADGELTVQGAVVLRSGQGERLSGDDKAASIIQARYDASAAARDLAARFSFQGYGNGVEYGASMLRSLVERHDGDVRDDRGQIVGDEKQAGDLVQKEWRGDLHSRKGRDVMHLIMSARAGTNVEAFENAARDFLAGQFAGHRYVFGMHDPANDPKEEGEGGKRPHVHAHAIVTMRSESGDRIETTPQVFREWRATMAEKARAQGIAMEMTDRREFASPAAFTRNQVRPVSREGRTEHVGTSEAAQGRYDAKRDGWRSLAKAERSREYAIKAMQSWQKIALASGDRRVVAYAEQLRDHLTASLSAGQAEASVNVVHADFGSKFRANLVTFQKVVLEGPEMRDTTRAEFEAYEKKVETALFRLERSVGPDERDDFDEVASVAREHVNGRRELMELYELKGRAQAEPGTATDRDEGQERRDDANEQWDAAVAKHGEAVVEAANDVLMDIETSREGLDRIEAGELSNDPRALRADIERGLARAAELAVQGNTYMREVAEKDPELKRAIEAAEQTQERPAEDKGKPPANVDAVTEQQRDPRPEEAERRPVEPAEQAHELASTVDATKRLRDKVTRDKEAAQRGGETTRTDPAQQHIPRLEELEREERERRERDRDDRDR
ncbi:conjugal transfer protein TraA [Mesorhizobium sp. M4B.F.Ca.ET.190.01.1.1]|uniref:conjugal transfer protein TraA n=1 Tax=unclassified Mesorhizobium TaxID=325217 RepID=UPI001091E6D4|nr:MULTISPECIES: conjugal transfer protein TraA [unclassified Mesorhizobium]TGR01001.1 conjugal transfer protein TraA [Mesorhizobium sp. M4B.F.Ca.ET.200.01.1.1]TGS12718.1 conjugal transfer protein TraA [Mesorhizobium sp. M4B.F.Ca.ET.190.01.1.1]TGT25343.1 conjugal transfer protein TraA [Mesorhizobium sp. M4B.F.Ca.ET.172.01.1.1]